MKTQKKLTKQFSCEFFPPKTEKGMENLFKTAETFKKEINPEFFSVTFGAGGSTRETTFNAVTKIKQSTGCDVAPHLSCIGSSKQQLKEILDDYQSQGINRIVTLRGDMPSGTVSQSDLNYANELVSFIRENYNNQFHIEVAAYPETHPQAENATKDILRFRDVFKRFESTQPLVCIYNVDSYFLNGRCTTNSGLDLPIIAGIMPITNYSNLARFSDMCGAEIPRWLRRKFESYADDTESIKDFGAEFVSVMCQKLLDMGAPGLHFYSMNQTEATLRIWNNLKL